jgi:hypothetical protein
MDIGRHADEDPDAEPYDRTNDQENPQRPAVPRQRQGVSAVLTAAGARAGNDKGARSGPPRAQRSAPPNKSCEVTRSGHARLPLREDSEWTWQFFCKWFFPSRSARTRRPRPDGRRARARFRWRPDSGGQVAEETSPKPRGCLSPSAARAGLSSRRKPQLNGTRLLCRVFRTHGTPARARRRVGRTSSLRH